MLGDATKTVPVSSILINLSTKMCILPHLLHTAHQAVSDAGAAADNGITDSWAEGDASLQSLEHDDTEKVTAAADHQVASVRESTEQAKEDLERYTRRQQWVIGVAEQRAQVC